MTILQQKLLVGSRRSFLTPSDGGMSQELKNVHIRGPVIPHLGSISRKNQNSRQRGTLKDVRQYIVIKKKQW